MASFAKKRKIEELPRGRALNLIQVAPSEFPKRVVKKHTVMVNPEALTQGSALFCSLFNKTDGAAGEAATIEVLWDIDTVLCGINLLHVIYESDMCEILNGFAYQHAFFNKLRDLMRNVNCDELEQFLNYILARPSVYKLARAQAACPNRICAEMSMRRRHKKFEVPVMCRDCGRSMFMAPSVAEGVFSMRFEKIAVDDDSCTNYHGEEAQEPGEEDESARPIKVFCTRCNVEFACPPHRWDENTMQKVDTETIFLEVLAYTVALVTRTNWADLGLPSINLPEVMGEFSRTYGIGFNDALQAFNYLVEPPTTPPTTSSLTD